MFDCWVVNSFHITVAYQRVYHLSLSEASTLVYNLSLVRQNLLQSKPIPAVFAVRAEMPSV